MDYTFNYNSQEYKFTKDETDKDKYIVFACAKNEDSYIKEWVDHYLNLGFDKIIIADNNDSPDTLRSILSEYISNGTVQIFECCGLKKFQLYIYNMYMAEANYKWCAYFDCDEFLELTVHSNIKDFLSNIKEKCVLLNWVVYGPDGNIHKSDKQLVERFKIPVLPIPFFKENFYVKYILRGDLEGAYLTNTHCPSYLYDMNLGGYSHVDYTSHVFYPPRYKYAYIKHYYTKSFDEWMNGKTKRGWPDEMFDVLKPANIFIVDKNPDFQIEKYTNGFFVDNNSFTSEHIHKQFDEIMSRYEVIHLYSSTKNAYSIVLHLFSMMREYKDHIFVLTDEFIDDALYGQMLSYAMISGNRIAYAFNDDEKFKILVNKAKWNNKFYYYMDCQ